MNEGSGAEGVGGDGEGATGKCTAGGSAPRTNPPPGVATDALVRRCASRCVLDALALDAGTTSVCDSFQTFTATKNASASSFAVEKRCPGILLHARASQPSNAVPSDGMTLEIFGGSDAYTATAIAPTESPSYGRCPVNASYTTMPSDQRSLRWSILFEATSCSGLMYGGLPRTVPVLVPEDCVLPTLAMPKSRIFTKISSPCAQRKMFSGLM